jgi:hypothetical protein
LALGAACKEPRATAPSWPAFPGSLGTARELVEARTRRPADGRSLRPRSEEALLDLLRQKPLVAGWEPIIERLQNELGRGSAFLLWGTHHDAGGQLEAFRRLLGPGGLEGLSAVTLEQLIADGRWRGIPKKDQRGISAPLRRYLAKGDAKALLAVRDDQRRNNYTGWKYRYLQTVTELMITARAGGLKLLPCDMPGALQRRSPGKLVDRVRELHCLLALEDALRSTTARRRGHIAMAWGQAHLDPDALPRFLDEKTRVVAVHVLGHRPGPAGLEHELAGQLLLADPVLVPLGAGYFVLLLDGPPLSARLQQSLDRQDRALPAELRHQLRVTAHGAEGQLKVAGKQMALEEDRQVVVSLSPGAATYLFESSEDIVVGSVKIARGGAVELNLIPDESTVRLLVQARQPP